MRYKKGEILQYKDRLNENNPHLHYLPILVLDNVNENDENCEPLYCTFQDNGELKTYWANPEVLEPWDRGNTPYFLIIKELSILIKGEQHSQSAYKNIGDLWVKNIQASLYKTLHSIERGERLREFNDFVD